jgi:alkaline phosphatase
VAQGQPRNVIFLVGDGMGVEHVKLARSYANGDTAPFNFELFPQFSLMGHNNASNQTTDSAASATAMATGVKVSNGVISVDLPGDGSPLDTSLELLQSLGKRSGLVTHSTDILDATPAAFAAHVSSRNNRAGIFGGYMSNRPNVLFGRTHSAIDEPDATAAGYTILRNASDLNNFNPASTSHVLGHWSSSGEASLATMTAKAIDLLSLDEDGFFLVVENEEIDTGGHDNDAQAVADGVLSLVAAAQVAIDWSSGRTDTLIIVTADHETGGLTVTGNNGAGELPDVTWSTTGHTQTPVGLWAFGPNSQLIDDLQDSGGLLDNTDVFHLTTVPEPGTMGLVALAGLVIVARRPGGPERGSPARRGDSSHAPWSAAPRARTSSPSITSTPRCV